MGKQVEHNVLAVFSLRDKAGRDNFAGVLDAMADTSDWHLHVLQPGKSFTRDDVLGRNGVGYDGFIVSMPGTPEAMDELVESRIPTVALGMADSVLAKRTDAISFVQADSISTGRCGAEHLLSRGSYKSVGYVHELKYEAYSYEREIGFRQTMKKAGYEPEAFPPDNDYSDYPQRLRAWLRNLPKPAAVMAVSDMRAADVINICREEQIAVPEHLAVVGVDNDLFQHRKCGMAISSVQLDIRELGRTAARELEHLFKCRKPCMRPREAVVSAHRTFSRESTARSMSAARLVQNALAFIEANRLRNIARADVVAHLGCSLQLAELRFRQIAGQTIREAIETARMNEVNRRMRQSGFSVRETAKAMGFTSANHLSRIYRRHFGRTISEAHEALASRASR